MTEKRYTLPSIPANCRRVFCHFSPSEHHQSHLLMRKYPIRIVFSLSNHTRGISIYFSIARPAKLIRVRMEFKALEKYAIDTYFSSQPSNAVVGQICLVLSVAQKWSNQLDLWTYFYGIPFVSPDSKGKEGTLQTSSNREEFVITDCIFVEVTNQDQWQLLMKSDFSGTTDTQRI